VALRLLEDPRKDALRGPCGARASDNDLELGHDSR